MIKFHIPGVEADRLHDTWEQLCRRFGSWAGYRVTKRHVRSITFDHHGVKQTISVGDGIGGDKVIVICELLDAFVVVKQIDLEFDSPKKVEKELVLSFELFD